MFAQAPPVLWNEAITGLAATNIIAGGRSAVDKDGNVFFASGFNLPVATIGNQVLTNQSTFPGSGSSFDTMDVFVAKYDDAGNFLWARQIGGNDTELAAAVATDPSGNLLVVVNSASSNIVSGTNVLATNLLTSTSAQSVVLVKFDPRGNILWARQALGSSYVTANSLAVDAAGDILEAGSYTSTNLFFGTNSVTNTNPATYIHFLAKYDANGNFLWAYQPNLGFLDRPATTMDPEGNAYILDVFTGVAYFGNTALTNLSFNTVALAKLDPNGNVLWAREAGRSSSYLGSIRAAIDGIGNCCVTAMFQADVTLQGTVLPMVGGGYTDALVAKYDGTGNLLWANSITGNIQEFAAGIAADPMGNVYATGENDSATMNIGTLTFTNAGPSFRDGYVVKYDNAGELLWAEVVPVPEDCSLDSHGNVYGSGGAFIATNNNTYGTFYASKISGPVVNIQPSGNQLVLSWPTNAAGLNLEYTANLSGGVWSPVTNVRGIVGSQFVVTNAVADPARFYRLRNF